MIYVTYKQWVEGTKYTDGYYGSYTKRYDTIEQFNDELDKSLEDNPMIVIGMWKM